jgi:GxxExxY protein
MANDVLTEKIIGCAFKVHRALGSGFLEKVYENALGFEIGRCNLSVRQQTPIKVWYANHIVGDFCADLLVEEKIIIELKAVFTFTKEHEVQLVNYLNATELDVGLLINFGPSVQVKRKFRNFRRILPTQVIK